jgi:hypothetical protein
VNSRQAEVTPGGLLERLADCLGLGKNPEMPRAPKSSSDAVKKSHCTNHVPKYEEEDFSPEPAKARYSAVSESRRRAFMEELLSEPEPAYPPPPLSNNSTESSAHISKQNLDFGVGFPPAA